MRVAISTLPIAILCFAILSITIQCHHGREQQDTSSHYTENRKCAQKSKEEPIPVEEVALIKAREMTKIKQIQEECEEILRRLVRIFFVNNFSKLP